MIKSILGGKSKNLFDISKADVVIHGDMSFSSNVSYNSHFYSIPVEAGQTYTVSYDTYAVDGGGAQITLSCQTGDFYQDGVSLFIQLTPENSINNWKHMTHTFTIPSGATKITFSSLKYPDYPKCFRNFQIELGSTATEYVPHELTSYKSIMKVSDVCQLVDPKHIHTIVDRGVTFTSNGDGSITVNGTPTGEYYSVGTIALDTKSIKPNHKYVVYDINRDPIISELIIANYQGGYIFKGIGNIFTFPEHSYTRFVYEIRVNLNQTANNIVVRPQLFDLTEMYRAGNEPKTVAEFKSKFPNDYYPYSPSCFVTSFDERMPCKTKNLFISSTKTGNAGDFNNTTVRSFEENIWYIGLSRNNYNAPHLVYIHEIKDNYIKVATRSPGYGVTRAFKVSPNKQYTISFKSNLSTSGVGFGFYDNTGKYLSEIADTFTVTTPTNCGWLAIVFGAYPANTEFVCTDIQLELGTTATDYVPYGYV